jgi:hypothetical protein
MSSLAVSSSSSSTTIPSFLGVLVS